jgi:hypothetical protein
MNRFLRPLVCIAAVAACAWSKPAPRQSVLDSANAFLVDQLYVRAENSLRVVLRKQPDNMDALYLLVATEQTRILDYESYNIDADNFVEMANTVLQRMYADLPRKKGPDSLKCLFYIGNIHGGISVMQAKVGNWPSAVKSGANSLGAFKRVIKSTPDFYPAYLGLGIFNYYISQNLKWLPFFGDRRQEGLDQVRLSTKAVVPYSYVAKNSLCWILVERNEFDEADSIATSVLAELPANTIFIRLKARIALWKREWPYAIFWARKLVALSEKRKPVNWSDLLSGYQILVSVYDGMGKSKECMALCKKALSQRVTEPYTRIPYVKKHLRYIYEIQKKYSR